MAPLLDHHADTNQKEAYPYYSLEPLHSMGSGFGYVLFYCAAQFRAEGLEILLEHRADVKKKGNQWDMPFHWAVRAGKTDMMRVLLDCCPEGTMQNDLREYSIALRGLLWEDRCCGIIAERFAEEQAALKVLGFW
jgi:hypothetical protein